MQPKRIQGYGTTIVIYKNSIAYFPGKQITNALRNGPKYLFNEPQTQPLIPRSPDLSCGPAFTPAINITTFYSMAINYVL